MAAYEPYLFGPMAGEDDSGRLRRAAGHDDADPVGLVKVGRAQSNLTGRNDAVMELTVSAGSTRMVIHRPQPSLAMLIGTPSETKGGMPSGELQTLQAAVTVSPRTRPNPEPYISAGVGQGKQPFACANAAVARSKA